MKIVNYIYTILLIAGLSLLGACQDFLDTVPDNRTDVDTEKKITSLLVSAYPTKQPLLINEMSSDNVMDNGSLYDIAEQEQEDAYLWVKIRNTQTDDEPSEIWEECYRAIAVANQALESIAELGDTTILRAQKAEALLCRAYSHFVLVNMFSQHYNTVTSDTDLGIPYVTETEKQIFVDYKRPTVAEVYKKINADIEAALPMVSDDIYTVPKYHFNTSAAYAFAARFNLYYGKYNKVIEYANRVLGDNPSNKLRDYTVLQSAIGYEDYSNLYIAADESANLLLLPLYSSYGYISGSYDMGRRYGHAYDIMETETYRASRRFWSTSNFVYGTGIYGFDEKVCIPKLDTYFEYTDKTGGIGHRHVVYTAFTVDETLLCRAEAYALTGEFDNAAEDLSYWTNSHTKTTTGLTRQDINIFYSGLNYVTIGTKSTNKGLKKRLNPKGFTIDEGSELENFIHCVLDFRRMETLFEGLRWYDIKRYGIEIYHNRENQDNDILKVDDLRRAYQIPDDAITAGITANPR